MGKPVHGQLMNLQQSTKCVGKQSRDYRKKLKSKRKTITQPSTSITRELGDKHPTKFNLMRRSSSPSNLH